jgi:hypothetical protein
MSRVLIITYSKRRLTLKQLYGVQKNSPLTKQVLGTARSSIWTGGEMVKPDGVPRENPRCLRVVDKPDQKQPQNFTCAPLSPRIGRTATATCIFLFSIFNFRVNFDGPYIPSKLACLAPAISVTVLSVLIDEIRPNK